MASALTSSFSPPAPGKKSLLERIFDVYHIIYTYDMLDRVTSMTSPAGTTKYHYDDSTGRLDEIETPQGKRFRYEYDRGRLRALEYPNGITANYDFDDNGNLTDLHYQRGDGSTVQRFQYEYDRNGMRTAMVDVDGRHDYTYDSLYQVVGATHPTVQNPLERFQYDAVGNRLSDNVKSAYRYNELNELTEDDSCWYLYDLDGNQTEKIGKASGDTTHCVFDIESKLVEVRRSGMVVQYSYDALGRRMEKDVNGVVTRFRYSGEDLILEMDESGAVKGSYTFGSGIDNPIAMCRGETNYYYVKDGVNSVTSLTDSVGEVIHEYKYGLFGQVVEENGDSVANPFTYTSREWEPDVGLYYYRERFYSPSSGRFLNEDPLGLEGSKNFYVYVENNPLNFIDPYGLASSCCNGDQVGACALRCFGQNGGFLALAAAGISLPGVSIPKVGRAARLAARTGTSAFTSLLSMINSIGPGRVLREIGRRINPISNLVTAGALSYAIALALNCLSMCSSNCNSW